MWQRLLIKSLFHRRSRIAVLAAALLLSSALVSAFLMLSGSVEQKAAGELSAYGPNLLVEPHGFDLALTLGGLQMGSVARAERLSQEVVDNLDAVTDIESFSPFLYGTGEISGQQIVITGASISSLQSLFPGWRWQGDFANPNAVYPGIELARRLGVGVGDTVTLTTTGHEVPMVVGGIVEVGGSEDQQLLMDLSLAQQLLDEQGIDLVLVRASGSGQKLAQAAADLESVIPASQVKVLSQVSESESRVLSRIRYIMGLVTALVLLASALAVTSTMTLLVWERRREIGLMKAIGAGGSRIALQFLSETWMISIAAALPGSLLGLAIARWIAMRVFASPVELNPYVFPITWLIIVGVTTAAAYLPVRRAAGIRPALVLKGD